MRTMIDIVIVNWNSGTFLADCLDSIEANAGEHVGLVTVVDNDSTDGSEQTAIDRPHVDLVKVEQNLGFGKGCNLGASRGTSKYILFLNPDARLLRDSLGPALAFLNSDQGARVGIVGAQLIDEDNQVSKTCSRFPTPGNLFCRSTGLDRVYLPWNSRMLEWDHFSSRRVDQVMGAFFLVRRQLFHDLGGFDERFFVYYEEVDLSKRAKAAGWSSWFLADAKAFHYGGGSSENVKATRLFYSLRSRLKYARKHFGIFGYLLTVSSTTLVEPLFRCLRSIVSGKPEEISQTLQGYLRLMSSNSPVRVNRKIAGGPSKQGQRD